jgi:hypothetical protein
MQSAKIVAVAVVCLVVGACLGAFVIGFFHASPAEKPSGEKGETVVGAPNIEAEVSLDFYSADKLTVIATIKNVGYKDISACNVTVHSDADPLTFNIGSIGVGQSVHFCEDLTNPPFTLEKEYEIKIVAVAADGTSVSKSLIRKAGPLVSQQLGVDIISVDIVKDSTTTLVSVTIRNTGNKPIMSCTVTVWGDSGTATLDLGALDIGESKSASTTNPSGFSVTVGKAYPVKVDATAADGSTFSKSFTVTCTG